MSGTTPHLGALVLAAGYSSRMGRFKPLLPFGQSTVIESAIESLRTAGIGDITVVAGHRAKELQPLLNRLGVRWVLNAAYESSILFEQFHAFESFAPEDIIFTHLDEEHRRVKLWNFVLGTKCPISFLGAGQKIPGEFRRAEPALLFPHKTTEKTLNF